MTTRSPLKIQLPKIQIKPDLRLICYRTSIIINALHHNAFDVMAMHEVTHERPRT